MRMELKQFKVCSFCVTELPYLLSIRYLGRFSLSGVGISQPIKPHLLLECYKANNNKVLDSSKLFSLYFCRNCSCNAQSKLVDLYQCISAGILWLERPWSNSGACTKHDHWSLYLTWADQEILFINLFCFGLCSHFNLNFSLGWLVS